MKRCALGAALGLIAGCSEPPPRPRPVEIPISEYRVDGPGRAPEASAPGSPSTSGAAPAASGGAADHEPAGESVASVPEEPRGADKIESKPSVQLDTKGGFLGATFGSSPRAHRGLVSVDKHGDAQTYRAPAKSYGGVALRDVFYVFRKNKLATIQFSVKNAADCKPMHETLIRELGAPQRATESTSVWRGEKTALRFVVTSSGACSGMVLSRDWARAEFDAM